MRIQKRIVTDENRRPVAVQIDYADWIKIERQLDLESSAVVACAFRQGKRRGGPVQAFVVLQKGQRRQNVDRDQGLFHH